MRQICLFIFFITILFIPAHSQPPALEPGVSRELANWRAVNYSDVRYKLNLAIEKGAPTLNGSLTISLQNKSDRIILDWRKIAGKESLSTIKNATINDKPAKFEEINEHLVFKSGVKPGENVIELSFTSPIATSGAAITRYVDSEDGAEYIYSLFVPSDASTAFPVFDQPDLKARFKLEVNSKTFERVVGNAIGKTSDFNTNTDRFTFAETPPISTYVFAFAAGDFVDFQENRPVNEKGEPIKAPAMEGSTENFRVFVRRSQAEKFRPHEKEFFRLTREGVKFLESYFDHKFPFSKYDTILLPEFPFGAMEHAGATFFHEEAVIFPTEPTAEHHIGRAMGIFHEAAHQWFGDTVTMKWFDDLWLKEGFAEFTAYKTLEKVLPQYDAWKIFYEKNKLWAYATDSTKGTTPIYQEISNLSAAKSAYGGIVYAKAPSFLRQAEFYLGEEQFRAAARALLKKYRYKNAEWKDLVQELETASRQDLKRWSDVWVRKRGLPVISTERRAAKTPNSEIVSFTQKNRLGEDTVWRQKTKLFYIAADGTAGTADLTLADQTNTAQQAALSNARFIFPNYRDYGYGVFLLDDKSLDYALKNVDKENDVFLRSMMWGALWESVREAELHPKEFVELAIKALPSETDETTIQSLLPHVSGAVNFYLSESQAAEIIPRLERLLIEKMQNESTLAKRLTFFRSFLSVASTEKARQILKDILSGKLQIRDFRLRTLDKFDLLTRLAILGDADVPALLENLRKTETSDEAKRYAYRAAAGFPSKETKAKYFNDYLNGKDISEDWIASSLYSFNNERHAELTLPYLERALSELPNLKRDRKIFFVSGWLDAFIGGQKSAEALNSVNNYLAASPKLNADLRLKILEAVDGLERTVKIRKKFGK